MIRFIAISCLVAGLGRSQVSPTPVAGAPGTLAGSIQGSDGSVVSAGAITLLWLDPPANSRSPRSVPQAISSSGSFSFGGLASGKYALCVRAQSAVWLNPCEWGQLMTFSVSVSQPVPPVTLILQQGAVIPIRIDDPAQALALNDSKTAGAQLLLGVTNDNLQFKPAPVISVDALGRNQQVVIPYGRTLNLVVVGAFFSIVNAATGLALPKTPVTLPLLVPLGSTPTAVHLLVAGVSP